MYPSIDPLYSQYTYSVQLHCLQMVCCCNNLTFTNSNRNVRYKIDMITTSVEMLSPTVIAYVIYSNVRLCLITIPANV